VQSAFPSVKSILSGATDTTEDDIKKRKAARRKSLANRRVSFAPEATLHTWDVVEYMKDATTSSASSESERRASSVSQEAGTKSPEPDSPEQPLIPASPSTPPKQSEDPLKRVSLLANQRDLHQSKRRRSSPIKAPEEVFSSPLSDRSPVKDSGANESDSDDMGDATMDLDDPTMQSLDESGGSTSSSARLDAALRQAAVHAETQRLDEDDGDVTMDLVDDEVTNAFKLWTAKSRRDSLAINRMIASQDQENVDPFKSKNIARDAGDTTEEVSMDITRAIGGIVQDDMSNNTTKTMRGLKRRRSSNLPLTESSGSPVKRPSTRRSLSRSRSSAEDSILEDQSMDLTMAVGSIQTNAKSNQESSDTSLGDETMDFTVAIGSIVDTGNRESIADTEALEDMSMELTENIGQALGDPKVPATPSPARKAPRESMLPPSVTVERPHTPQKSPLTRKASTVGKKSVGTPSRHSPRKSLQAKLIDEKVQMSTPKDSRSSNDDSRPQPDEPHVSVVQEDASANIASADITSTLEMKQTTKTSLSDSLKLLSTPRKEILPSHMLMPTTISKQTDSPAKKPVTPRKGASPKRSITFSRTPSPRKRVKLDVKESPNKQAEETSLSDIPEGERISLQDFLTMTNIRFMDLTTTKRRATGFPGAEGILKGAFDTNNEDQEPSVENNVAAAVAIVPMLSMYQHVSTISLIENNILTRTVLSRNEVLHL
jgi:kinetochore protein Spc7/SPC105